MRIDGFNPAYLPERSAKQQAQSAAVSFRDIQRDQEIRREQPQPSSASQGTERYPLLRQVEQTTGAPRIDNEPISQAEYKPSDSYVIAGLSSQAREALSAYMSTASFTFERETYQIVGVDLYA